MINIFCVLLSLSFATQDATRVAAGDPPQLPADHKIREFVDELEQLGMSTDIMDASTCTGEGTKQSLNHITHLAFNFIEIAFNSIRHAFSGRGDICNSVNEVRKYLKEYLLTFNSRQGIADAAVLVALQGAAFKFVTLLQREDVALWIQSLPFESRLLFWIGVGVIRQFLGSQALFTSALGVAVGSIENGIQAAASWEYFVIQIAMVMPPAVIPVLLTKFTPNVMKFLNRLMMKTPVGYYANGLSKVVLTRMGFQLVGSANRDDAVKSVIVNHLAPASGAHGTGFYGPLIIPSIPFSLMAAPMGAAEELFAGCAGATLKNPSNAVTKDMILFNGMLIWNAIMQTTPDNILPAINVVQGFMTWAYFHLMDQHPSTKALILSMVAPALFNALFSLLRQCTAPAIEALRQRMMANDQNNYVALMG